VAVERAVRVPEPGQAGRAPGDRLLALPVDVHGGGRRDRRGRRPVQPRGRPAAFLRDPGAQDALVNLAPVHFVVLRLGRRCLIVAPSSTIFLRQLLVLGRQLHHPDARRREGRRPEEPPAPGRVVEPRFLPTLQQLVVGAVILPLGRAVSAALGPPSRGRGRRLGQQRWPPRPLAVVPAAAQGEGVAEEPELVEQVQRRDLLRVRVRLLLAPAAMPPPVDVVGVQRW